MLAPENTSFDHLLTPEKQQEVQAYRNSALAKTAVQRQQDVIERTGVDAGVSAKHPLTGELVPVRFADYVLMDYGSGAVMMVPAHDERDREFAQKFGIPVKQVIASDEYTPESAYTGTGALIESAQFTGMNSTEAKQAIITYLEEQ